MTTATLKYFFSISSILFYLAWALCNHLISADPRTSSKRLLLFTITAAACGFEMLIRSFWLDISTAFLWRFRSVVCLFSTAVIAFSAVTHHDKFAMMQAELEEIRALLARGPTAKGHRPPGHADLAENSDEDFDFHPQSSPSDGDDDDQVDIDEDDVDQSDDEGLFAEAADVASDALEALPHSDGTTRYPLRRTAARRRSISLAPNPILLQESADAFTELFTTTQIV